MTDGKINRWRSTLNRQKPMTNDVKTETAPENSGNGDLENTVEISPSEIAEQNPTEQTSPENETDWKACFEELQVRFEQERNDYLRKAAEFENARRRLTKEKEEFAKYANEKLVQDIFPVLDSLEMTLSHTSGREKDDPIVSGVQLILKQLLQMLQKYGLEEVSGEGQAFDPNQHEAIGTVPAGEAGSGKVATVHRKGYKLKDRLLRAALVTITD